MKEIKDKILEEYKKGNIVLSGIEGLRAMPIKEFIKQPIEGMLYDLNRNEAVVLTFLPDPKWINDYAVAKVIAELKNIIDTKKLPRHNVNNCEDLKHELEVTDKLLDERQKVLDAIPECRIHGKCVPHAIEWIEEMKAKHC